MDTDEGVMPPLLDQLDAGVKKLIGTAKKRGYVTHEQINSLSNEYTRGGQLKKRHWYHDTARVGQVQKENWHIVISA